MTLTRISVAVFGLVVVGANAPPTLDLETISVCSARFSNGTIVDLSSLVADQGRARFRAVEAPDESVFYYDPCGVATADVTVAESPCCGGKACLCWRKANMFTNIGDVSSARFRMEGESGPVFVEYRHESAEHGEYRTKVFLVCVPKSEEDELRVGRANGSNFDLALLTSHACPPPERSNSLLAAFTLDEEQWFELNLAAAVMAFCSVVGVLYVVFGLICVKFREGTTGKERIAESALWKKIASIRPPVFVGGSRVYQEGYEPRTPAYVVLDA